MTQDLTIPDLFLQIPDEARARHRAIFILIAEAMEQMAQTPISPFFMFQAIHLANSALGTAVLSGLCEYGDYVILTRGWVVVARCRTDGGFEFSFSFCETEKAPRGGLFLEQEEKNDDENEEAAAP